MKRHKQLYVLLLCSLRLLPAQAQVFWTESFAHEGATILNWVNSGTNPGLNIWAWSNDPVSGFQDPELSAFAAPSGTDGYFLFDSHNNGLVQHEVELTGYGKTADCSGKTDVHLRFFSQYIYFNPSGTVAEVGVSTDGTHFSYTPLFTNQPPNFPFHDWVDVDLDSADNQPKVWLRFRWTGRYEYHWKIDDLSLSVACDQNSDALICDDFDDYDPAQKLGPQAGHWTTRSGQEGGAEDGVLASDQVNSPPYVLKITGETPDGSPQHAVLDLGSRNSGHYELEWKMYVPANKQAFFDFLSAVPVITSGWDLGVYFEAGQIGRIRQTADGAVLREFNYLNDQWFDVKQLIDLDNKTINLFVNGKFVLKRAFTITLGGIEFTGANEQNQYYVDDIIFVKLPPVNYHPDSCETAEDITQYFGQQPGTPQVTGLFDNTDAGVSTTDPQVDCWNEAGTGGIDILNNTLWFTFTGDGGTYDIQTVPCSATHYIGEAQGNKGDTQMLVYSGENCTDLTEVQCNDDLFLSGQPDFRAGVTLETMPGQTYFMLIDGFEAQGIVAIGEFCIQITQKPAVSCEAAQVGAFTLSNGGYLCANESLADILSIQSNTFSLPTIGPEYGISWCFSANPLPANAWPGTIPGIASTPLSQTINTPILLNNGQTLDYGAYYLTPVVLGGGNRINPGAQPNIFNIDPDTACYFIGASKPLTLLPPLTPIDALATPQAESLPPGNNGAIELKVTGGAGVQLDNPALYQFKWSNGKTTKDISNLAAGTYTVTIVDATGCVAPLVLSVTVQSNMVDTTDPDIFLSLQINPNPARDAVLLQLILERPADVQVELIDLLGQVLLTKNAGTVQTLSMPFNLDYWSGGVYLLQVRAGGERALRRVVVQH